MRALLCKVNGAGLGIYLAVVLCLSALLIGAVKFRWGFVPRYTCAGRDSLSLITHISIVPSMGA